MDALFSRRARREAAGGRFRRTGVVVLCSALAGVAPAPSVPAPAPSGEATVSLDLRGAVGYALDHSPTLANRRATLAGDEAIYARDHAAEFPPVTGLLQNQLQRTNGNENGSLAQYGIAPQTKFSQNTAQIGSVWNAYNGSNDRITAQRAKRQVESDRADLARAREQVTQNVSDAYFAVSVRNQTVVLDEADAAYQQELLAVARDNERVGRAAGVDVLRSQVNALRAQATLVTARSDEETARETLATTIGAPPDQPFTFADVIPEPPMPDANLSALVALALGRRPDVASATAALQNAQLADALIDTDRYPTLQLTGAFGNQFSPTTTFVNPLTGQAVSGPRGNPGFWQIGATETLQIGIIDYGSRHAQHRAACAGIAAARIGVQAARDAVETDVRQTLRGAQTAAANLTTAKQAAALGTEAARIARLQYTNGLISLTDATQAERDNVSAQNDLVNARVGYVDAVIHLRVATGTDPLAAVDFRPS